MDLFDYDEDLVGEAPCEFCGELYPLILLIEHQSTHLAGAEDNYQYFDDILDTHEGQSIIAEEIAEKKSEPKVTFEQIQTSAAEEKVEGFATNTTPIRNEPEVTVEQRQISPVGKKQEDKKFQTQKMKEFTTESGEKLLVYGTDMDPDKDLESEKEMYKMPHNPLLSSVCNDDDVEDINNLSDDDCSESLEEFWKRARDFLKRSRVKSEV